MKNVIKTLFLAVFVAAFFSACQKETIFADQSADVITLKDGEANVASTPVSDGDITPYIIPGAEPGSQGGNRTCAEAAAAFGVESFEFPTDKVDFNGSFAGSFPGFDVKVTDGTFVEWSFTPPAGYCVVNLAVIVKGSDDANVYFYGAGQTSDSGLASPVNARGNPAGLSNLTFCYNLEPCNGGDRWEGETAWAFGPRYAPRGNWATYVKYDGVEKTVTLFAGQTINAGTVTFSAPVDGKVSITIDLADGFRLAEGVLEQVKIQDYATAPSGNPEPGLFAYKGSRFTVTVPDNKFYGVHVDVEQKVDYPIKN